VNNKTDGFPPVDQLSSRPLHRAIDRLTTALIEAQHLQKRIDSGEATEQDITHGLHNLEHVLRDLGASLCQLRERNGESMGTESAERSADSEYALRN
jgi:hypothetical protein